MILKSFNVDKLKVHIHDTRVSMGEQVAHEFAAYIGGVPKGNRCFGSLFEFCGTVVGKGEAVAVAALFVSGLAAGFCPRNTIQAMDTFRQNLQTVYPNANILYDEAVTA